MRARLRLRLRDFIEPGVRAPDDRGREVLLEPQSIDPEDWPTAESGHAPNEAEAAPAAPCSIREWLNAIAGITFILLVLAVMLGTLGFGVMAISRQVARAFHTSMFVAVPMTIGTGALACLLWDRVAAPFQPRQQWHPLVEASLRFGLCPACGYEIGSLPADPDGCTPCPECGAAWNLARWAREFPPLSPPANQPPRRSARRYMLIDARRRSVEMLANQPDQRRDRFRSELKSMPATVILGDLVRVALVIAPAIVIAIAFGWPPEGLSILAFLCIEALVIPAVLSTAVSARREAIRAHFVKRRVGEAACPCCEGRLRTTPASIDNALVCETCGCAWTPV